MEIVKKIKGCQGLRDEQGKDEQVENRGHLVQWNILCDPITMKTHLLMLIQPTEYKTEVSPIVQLLDLRIMKITIDHQL